CECVVVTLFYRRDFLFSIYTKYFTLSSNIKTSTKLICKLFKLDKISNIDDVKSKILTRKVSEPVKLTAQDKKMELFFMVMMQSITIIGIPPQKLRY
ncbi:hypothetical protein P6Z38_10595, partial [Enterococcus faecium]|uniref:hypothetical protein n=4 Tax=Enterococcus faecium TaxID=1352 RepID=UPI001A9220F3